MTIKPFCVRTLDRSKKDLNDFRAGLGGVPVDDVGVPVFGFVTGAVVVPPGGSVDFVAAVLLFLDCVAQLANKKINTAYMHGVQYFISITLICEKVCMKGL